KPFKLPSQRRWRKRCDRDHRRLPDRVRHRKDCSSLERALNKDDLSNLIESELLLMIKKSVLLSLLLFCCVMPAVSASSFTSSTPAADSAYLYRVNLVQAAPGKLVELIDLYKARAAEMKEAGDEAPLWMRHSQGDHWDLMILFPMGSYADYYQPERIAK